MKSETGYAKNVDTLSDDEAHLIDQLIPIVKRWCLMHEHYVQCSDGEVSFAYGERSQVSLLGAAVWQEGGVALCDYSEEKTKWFPSIEDTHPFLGACDIYAYDKTNELYEFYAEAKYERVTISPSREWSEVFDRLQHLADTSAYALVEDHGEEDVNGMGAPILSICFRMLSITGNKVDDYKGYLEKYIDSIKNYDDYNLSGWYFFESPYGTDFEKGILYPVGTSIHLKHFASIDGEPSIKCI